MYTPTVGDCSKSYCADSGVPLDPEKVRAGRERELSAYARHKVWHLVPTSTTRGKKCVRVKWVERNLGDKVRSRLCAMEFNVLFRADVHAGTPPLGVIRLLLSLAACRSWLRIALCATPQTPSLA